MLFTNIQPSGRFIKPYPFTRGVAVGLNKRFCLPIKFFGFLVFIAEFHKVIATAHTCYKCHLEVISRI
jgi:hypothetical protein